MPRVKKSFYTGVYQPPKIGSTSLSQESGKYRQHSHQPGSVDVTLLASYGRCHTNEINEYRLKQSGNLIYVVISQTGDIHSKVREILIGENVKGNFSLFPKIKLSTRYTGDIYDLLRLIGSELESFLNSAKKFCRAKYQPTDSEKLDKPTVKKVLHCPTVGKVKLIK